MLFSTALRKFLCLYLELLMHFRTYFIHHLSVCLSNDLTFYIFNNGSFTGTDKDLCFTCRS